MASMVLLCRTCASGVCQCALVFESKRKSDSRQNSCLGLVCSCRWSKFN